MATVSRLIPTNALIEANCLSSDAVGDCVYIVGDRVGPLLQVTRGNPRILTQIPFVGVIDTKLTTTSCFVRTAGPLTGVYTGLLLNQQLWVGLNGRLTAVQSSITALPGSKVAVQQMGVSLASDIVELWPLQPIIRVG